MGVGISNFVDGDAEYTKFKFTLQKVCDSFLCVIKLDGNITFNESIQKAVLPEKDMNLPHWGSMVYVVGYGRTMTSDYEHRLSYNAAYLYKDLNSVEVLLSSGSEKPFVNDWREQGAAVIDPESFVVYGLTVPIYSIAPKHVPFMPLEKHIDWIAESQKKLNDLD